MRKFKYLGLVIFSLCIILFSFNTYSKGSDKNKKQNQQNTVYKPTVDPSTSIVNINNISSIIVENGQQPAVLGGLSFNGEIPKGSQLGAVYQEGLVWGGIVSDGRSPVVRVGGCTYDVGNVATTRLVRVRPDYQTADLTQDAAGFFQIAAVDVTPAQIDEVRAQYAKDWQEWPANLGASYEDVDGNGSYDPNVDIPGIPGASQTLFIGYDDREATSLYASPVIGIQVFTTFWAYATSNPLGNVIFKKVQMIYTGTPTTPSDARIDSMYIAQFSDADVGNYTDDFAGSVPELDLGYAYSSTGFDQKYTTQGLVPPAVGYDFLQGASYFTGEPSDSAIINLKWRIGYKYFQEKPMSSFIYFAAGGAWSDPALVSNSGNYDTGTLQMYNLLRGYLPSPNYPSASLFPRPDEFGGPVGGFGTFLLDGNPATGQGWIDGIVETPGDRRILCINGPISIAKNDTIEVVLALIGAQGVSNISSVSILKYYDTFAQFAYDVLFEVPIMPQPKVQAIALDKQVVLNWGADQSSIDAIESQHGEYTFEAYTVYQLPTTTTDLSQGVPIATFDVVNNVTVLREIQLDENAGETYVKPVRLLNNIDGIKRFLTINKDFLNNRDLINGQSYRFAVTAIAYNEALEPSHILESTPIIVDLTPHSPNPGTRYSSSSGDTLEVTHDSGVSEGQIIPIVVDPSLVTGHQYGVSFFETPGGTTWSLTDIITGNVKLSGQVNQSGDDTYAIVDGIMVKVTGPPEGMKDWDIPNGTRRFTFADGYANFEGFEHTIGWDDPAHFFGSTTERVVKAAELKNVLLKLATANSSTEVNPDAGNNPYGGWNIDDPSLEENFSYGYRYMRRATNPAARPEFAPYIVNPSAGYAYQDYKKGVPLSAWNVEVDPPQRLAIGHLENNDPLGLVDGKWWSGANGTAEGSSGATREWLFIFNAPYTDATSDPALQQDILNTGLPVMWWLGVQRRGGADFSAGDEFLILANHINTANDVFTFTSPSVTADNELAKTDVDKVNVFPNPYYGYNSRETSREGHYVTFNHLPVKAIIRIFDLAGVLVRTIEKNDASTQFQTWDLRNDNNYPVASGIYIAYIDMPEQGKTKILKIAMIQEIQVLPVY